MSDDLLTELRHHETEYQELVHGPLCGRAADEIERLSAIIKNVCFALGHEDHALNT